LAPENARQRLLTSTNIAHCTVHTFRPIRTVIPLNVVLNTDHTLTCCNISALEKAEKMQRRNTAVTVVVTCYFVQVHT